MHHYTFLIGNNKHCATRHFVNHCIILDRDTMMCYHSSNPEGYVCEPLSSLLERYDIVDAYEFESEHDVRDYFYERKYNGDGYNLLYNNCETFANGFYGKCHSKQTIVILGGVALSATAYLLIRRLINK